jgi:hypothetical protein
MKTYGDIAFLVDEKLKFRQIGMVIAAVTVMSAIGSAGDGEASALVRREHRVGSDGAGEEREFCFIGALGRYGSVVGQ